ncbi:uncharacterized protein LOC124143526 [Haliotis rufescens]|uniref:uncharacterized protein LOC124143526 n=1 Tax=Haliotis rufescens TaxID=6454 RepID=UPI00201F73FC|nr:uncharacterized protein LOC124143526 [Haliotis rufescens]
MSMRSHYLRTIHNYNSQGFQIIYLDESFHWLSADGLKTPMVPSALAVADSLVLWIGLLPMWVSELTGFDIQDQSEWLCLVPFCAITIFNVLIVCQASVSLINVVLGLRQMAKLNLVCTISELLMPLNHASNIFLYCMFGQKFRNGVRNGGFFVRKQKKTSYFSTMTTI